jgi:hypothetical protein
MQYKPKTAMGEGFGSTFTTTVDTIDEKQR